MHTKTHENQYFPTHGTAEFNLAIEQGLKRAPQERAKAVKEFFRWLKAA